MTLRAQTPRLYLAWNPKPGCPGLWKRRRRPGGLQRREISEITELDSTNSKCGPSPLVVNMVPECRLEFEYIGLHKVPPPQSLRSEMSKLGSSTYPSSGQWRRLRRSREREVLWWRLEPIAARRRHRLPKWSRRHRIAYGAFLCCRPMNGPLLGELGSLPVLGRTGVGFV